MVKRLKTLSNKINIKIYNKLHDIYEGTLEQLLLLETEKFKIIFNEELLKNSSSLFFDNINRRDYYTSQKNINKFFDFLKN